MMKSILFLTSTNLAANPRLLKELKLATENGFSATVIQFSVGNWSDAMTIDLQQQFPGVEFIQLSALRKPFRSWLLSTFYYKLCNLIPLAVRSNRVLSISAGKRSFLLLQELRKIKKNHDWVIAHNPAAFYPASWYGKTRGAKVGIDVEDYHPGETTDVKAADTMRVYMRSVLTAASYCSYAAPLIAEEVQKDIPGMPSKQLIVLNGFDAAEFTEPLTTDDDVLKLIWFSQHIDSGRGLELVLPVVNELYPKVELHLVGQLNQSFAAKHLSNKTGIVLHEPMQQKQLHLFLANFDAGLATDIPVNRNRDIALTNKIIAYAQAGLAIAAMHTSAQDLFLKESDLHYEQMENESSSIRAALLNLYQKKKNAELNKQEQFQKGQQFAWQNLSHSLLTVWEKTYA
jgi:hypothetical protein